MYYILYTNEIKLKMFQFRDRVDTIYTFIFSQAYTIQE